MKTIPLSQGKVAIVDDEDYAALSKHKWYARKSNHGFYAVRNRPTADGAGMIRMHNEILSERNKPYVDHINRDSLDNRRANLRPATHEENQANRGVHSDNASGFKGVSWSRRSEKWRCRAGGRHIGFFPSKELAASAYNIVARNLYGDFAVLNNV